MKDNYLVAWMADQLVGLKAHKMENRKDAVMAENLTEKKVD
jgi:hypothetical protein